MSDDLSRRDQSVDWSLAIGLRRLVTHIVVRTLIVIALDVGAIWMFEAFAQWLGSQAGTGTVSTRRWGWFISAFGFLVGWVMSFRLSDALGFESTIVVIGGLVGLVAAGLVANAIVTGPLTPSMIAPTMSVAVITFFACVVLVFWLWHEAS